ncbi:competence/damage-inducible protein A [Nocardioides sp. R-C-SC26]|uniref:competence/damage-inducible protein A n=1 Tax=Nocardioides sp. R-C-SC26 TaxID=2870414 RepID=UPI001E4A142B|nr:competence/damage-inducible protein A [Nocardioides sp. R-C-SC26]
MTTRAGIVVTGTEVLTGRVTDANGPWLAEELRREGVDVGRIVVVGDRRDDLASALRYLSSDHDLVITTGGLGPTADDLTVDVVAEVLGCELRLDHAWERRIAARVDELSAGRGWQLPPDVVAHGVRKQARVPHGAVVLEPVGTAPGMVVTPSAGVASGAPPVVVLPGPPSELRPMWPQARDTDVVRRALGSPTRLSEKTVRIWARPESELAAVLRAHESRHGQAAAAGLEITTCLREGELEIVTRFAPGAEQAYEDLVATLQRAYGADLFSTGPSVDEVVAESMRSRSATIATAESCTAGQLASRIADIPGSSAYLLGGFVTYANDAKTAEVGVPPELLDAHGAVSAEVARAMAEGARARLGTTYGIGITGVAGPGGGTSEKPVGLVHVCLVDGEGALPRRLMLRGDRAAIRRRTTTECLHLLRLALER